MAEKFRAICSGKIPALSDVRLQATPEPHLYLNPKKRDEASVRGSCESLLSRLEVWFSRFFLYIPSDNFFFILYSFLLASSTVDVPGSHLAG